MMTDSADQDQILAALLAREVADRAAESPASTEPEELLDFLRGGLSTEEQEALQEKLVGDPEASRRLLDIEGLVRDGEAAAADPTGDLAAAAGWRDLQARLPAPTRELDPDPVGRDSRSLGPIVAARSSPFWLQPVAAMLLLSAIGLSILLLQRPTTPTLDFANLQMVQLASGQRSSAEVPPVAVAPGEPVILLMDPERHCLSYRLTIRSTDTNSVTTLEGLRRDNRGAGGTLVPLVRLAPGSYTAILEGCSPQVELERHSFQVVEAP